MKRLLLLWMMILCLTLSPFAAAQAEGSTRETRASGDFQYVVLEDGTAEITGYTGSETDIVIPDMVDHCRVTAIGDRAFQFVRDKVRVTSIALPDGIRTIGDFAFSGSKLMSVELPETLVSIGAMAFSGTPMTEITLPRSLVHLGGTNCFGRSLTKISVSPDNPHWQVIDGMLFRKEDACLFLCPGGLDADVLTIPEGTVIIGSGAFASHTALESVTVPEGVMVIEEYAFGSCDRLSAVTLPGSLREIGSEAFRSCGFTSVSLPEGLTILGDRAFDHCSSLTGISLPASLTKVGVNPFTSCDCLEEVSVSADNPVLSLENGMLFSRSEGVLISCIPSLVDDDCIIPDGVSVIGAYSFNGTWVETVDIPEGVTEIRAGAFEDCVDLEEVALPGSLRSIGDESFCCSGLTGIDLPEGLVHIGKEAFTASGLETIRLSSTVREIDGNPFTFCVSLSEITAAADSPYFEIINGTLIDKTEMRLVCWPERLRHGRCEIPACVRVIGYEAFAYTEDACDIVVPEGVTTLEDRSFAYCTDAVITLPASLKEISPSAFYDQGAGGPTLRVVPGSAAEAYCRERGLRCTLTGE